MNCRWVLPFVLGASMMVHGGDNLSDAAANGDTRAMTSFVAAGESLNEIDTWGWTPLMWTAFFGQERAARWLLDRGADPNIKATKLSKFMAKGITALGIAARSSQPAVLAILLESKADPGSTDEVGYKALDYAQQSRCRACASLLEGKPRPSTSLHSSTHPVIKGTLEDVFVLVESGAYNSGPYLEKVKAELDVALDKHQVRHLVCIADPLNLDAERDLAKLRDAFKPKYLLEFSETSASVKIGFKDRSRSYSEFQATLIRNGETAPVWLQKVIYGEFTWGPYNQGIVHRKVVASLMDLLEEDQLLHP